MLKGCEDYSNGVSPYRQEEAHVHVQVTSHDGDMNEQEVSDTGGNEKDAAQNQNYQLFNVYLEKITSNKLVSVE